MEVRKMWRRKERKKEMGEEEKSIREEEKKMEEMEDKLQGIAYVIGRYKSGHDLGEKGRKEAKKSYTGGKLALEHLVSQSERSEIIKILRKLLSNDSDDDVQCGAARILGFLGASEAVDDLTKQLISDTSLSVAASDAITQILGKAKEKKRKG